MKKFPAIFVGLFLTLALVVPSLVSAAVHTWGEQPSINPGSGGGPWDVASDADGSHMIAGYNESTIWISTDGGTTWTNRPLPNTGVGSSVRVVSDATGAHLLVGQQSARLYTSTDSGVTWIERQPEGDVSATWEVSMNSDGSVLAVLGGENGFLYTSDDGGATWNPHATPSGAFVMAPTTDGTHFVIGVFGGSLYTSADGGDSWTPRSLTSSFWDLASDADGTHLIARADGRIYTSTNSGANWTERQPEGDITSSWKVGIDSDGSDLIVAGGSANSTYTSDDGGVTWFEEAPVSNSGVIGVASDADASNLMVGTDEGLFISPDNVPPSIVSFDPVDDAAEVGLNETFDVVFDGPIATSTGNITLHLASDDSLVETIDVAGPKVTLSDTDTLTVDPTTTLEVGTEYYFLVDAGVVEDLGGNPFAGISDPTTWNFITDTPPGVSSFAPGDNDTDAALDILSNGNVYIYFDQDIAAGTGNITLKRASDDSTVVALDVNDPESYVYVDGSSANLYYPVTLEYATDYYFLIDAGAIEDTSGNAFVGIADETTWNFTTRDAPVAPTYDFERVSISDEGVEGDSSSYNPSVSGDGRYIAFSSNATNLVSDDTNDCEDIFVYDRDTNTIERVSVSSEGDQGNDCSYDPRISQDGLFVTFQSDATNFVGDDTNGAGDVFVYDRTLDSIERVSVNDAGVEGDNGGSVPDISSDGRYVAFKSSSTNLVLGDTNGYFDIFVYDRDTDTIERVSVNDEGEEAVGGDDGAASNNPVISADGRFVAFESFATNLVTDDTNDMRDVFVYDRNTNTIERVSVDDEGIEGDDPSENASISSDGQYIVFSSSATNLTGDTVNGDGAIFLRDRTLGTTVLIGDQYIEGNAYASNPDISDDGRYVVYSAYDAPEGNRHIYRFNTNTSVEFLVTEEVGDIDQPADTRVPSVSGNGSVIAFQSSNTDLVDDDTNDVDDIFVWEGDIDEETSPDDDEDTGGTSGSHRRSGGGGIAVPGGSLLEQLQLKLIELLTQLLQELIKAQAGTL